MSIPPPARKGNENSEGRGVQKEATFERVGVSYREFFPGAPTGAPNDNIVQNHIT